MSTVLEAENGGDVNPVAEQVENFISKKIARVAVLGVCVVVAHSFVAGGAWVGLTKTDEQNTKDIVELAEIQKETANKLEGISTTQAELSGAIEDVKELKTELRQINATMQEVRDDVVELRVRIDRSSTSP